MNVNWIIQTFEPTYNVINIIVLIAITEIEQIWQEFTAPPLMCYIYMRNG